MFELQELHLLGNGREIDLSDDWARLEIGLSSHNLKSWSVQVDNTDQFLAPDNASYKATMVTTGGQQFTGTVWCRKAHMASSSDNVILLQGTGPLHGYVP